MPHRSHRAVETFADFPGFTRGLRSVYSDPPFAKLQVCDGEQTVHGEFGEHQGETTEVFR
jgi:hypothetical protein